MLPPFTRNRYRSKGHLAYPVMDTLGRWEVFVKLVKATKGKDYIDGGGLKQGRLFLRLPGQCQESIKQ